MVIDGDESASAGDSRGDSDNLPSMKIGCSPW